jgi:signal transduction histidine kinase
VLQTTVDQLGVVGGAIYLLNSDASSLQMAAHIGISPDTLRLVTGITPDGLETRPIIDENLSIREQTGISAVLSVPIWRQEQIQGIITLVHDQTRPWRDDDFRMLDAIGRQIGVALANAELYSEAARGEAQVRAILQSVADGLLVFDQNANLILMNPAAEALFAFYPGGASKAARYLWEWLQEHHMLGNGTAESIEFALPITPLSGDVTPNFNDQCVLQHCMGTERADLGWPCWLQPSGNLELQVRMCQIYQRIPRRAIQAHSAQVRDGEGSILGNVIALHDVTYYRELDELKGRFVSTVSHELRTPLSAMMLQVSTLLRYYDRIEEESRREMIGEIHEQTNILRELIEDILELSRFDAKRSMPQKQWFYMDDQCQDVIHSLQPMMNEKRINVLFEHESGPRHYYGDPNQLMRAFRNVLSNAVKYTPEDGRVTVRIQQHGTELHLSVEDTGIGIAPDEQPHVFERFFRAESASQIASGTGLGLSITKEIVDLHLGRLELLSQLGVGSTFTICLPIGDGDPPTQERQLL